MVQDGAYLVSYFKRRGAPVARKHRREYLSYYGLGTSSVYVLVSGVVKASVIMREGREFNISYIAGPSPVSLLRDEASARAQAPFNVRVESTEATYLTIPRVDFWRCVNAEERLRDYVKEYYRASLDDALRRMRHLAMNGKTGAVGSLLYELARDFGEPCGDGTRIGLTVTNEDIAGFCGISSRNSVNRILRGFREAGVVATGGADGEIVVLDPEYLSRYALD